MTTPSAKMTTLLSFQLFFIYRTKFSCFVFFSASVLGRLWVKGTAVSITSAVVFSLSVNTISGLLQSTVSSVTIGLSQYKIMFADSSMGSDLYRQYGGVFLSSSIYSKTCLKRNLKGPEHFSAKARFPFNQGTLPV